MGDVLVTSTTTFRNATLASMELSVPRFSVSGTPIGVRSMGGIAMFCGEEKLTP